MKLADLTKAERSLLLMFECCVVDRYGGVESIRMNREDFDIADRWNESGFVRFGRIYSKDIRDQRSMGSQEKLSHWCELSDDAWRLAHEERRARFERMKEKRWFTRTEELREEAVTS